MAEKTSAFNNPIKFDINKFNSQNQAYDGSMYNPYSYQNSNQNPMYASMGGNMNAATLQAIPGANMERSAVSSMFNQDMAQNSNMKDFLNTQSLSPAMAGQNAGVDPSILQARGSEFTGQGQGLTSQSKSAFQNGRATIFDSNQMNLVPTEGLEGKPLTNALQQNEMISSQNAMGQFDWGGAFDVGMSAFNAFNQYNYQNDMMDMYKGQISDARAERARKNKTRDAWSNAYSK